MTLRKAVQLVLRIVERRRGLIGLPFGVSLAIAGATEIASALTLGAFPKVLTTTPDQVELLREDNIVSEKAIAEGRTFAGLGIDPQGIEAIAPAYLVRFRKTGQYAPSRIA